MDTMERLGSGPIDVEALIAQGPPKPKAKRIGTQGPVFGTPCQYCGGYIGNAPEEAFFCRCWTKNRRVMDALTRVDRNDTMTLGRFAGDTKEQREALHLIHEVIEGKREGVTMIGSPGIGKTHLSVAALRSVAEQGKPVGYFNVVDLVSRVQATYRRDSTESRRDIVEDVTSRHLVVLDDLGKERQSEDVRSIVYELIDALYGARRQVIICSNMTAAEYQEYDSAVRSRIAGMTTVTVVSGQDRRRT